LLIHTPFFISAQTQQPTEPSSRKKEKKMVSCQLLVLFISSALATANAGAVSLAGRQAGIGCGCWPEGNEQPWGTKAPSTRIMELCRENTEEYSACVNEDNIDYCAKWDNPASCECIAQEVEPYQVQASDKTWYMVSNPVEL
jgi:hypothetical protein